jgi:hypothetical protein
MVSAAAAAAAVSAAAVSAAAVSAAVSAAKATSESTASPVKAAKASAKPACSYAYTDPKTECPNLSDWPSKNGGISVGFILRPRPGPVNHSRVVSGHIYNFRINGFNLDVLTFDNHLFLRAGLEIAGGISFMPQSLNGCRDIGLLIHEGLAQPVCPVPLLGQHVEDLRKRRERLNAVVPRLLLQGAIERLPLNALVCMYPTVRTLNLIRIRSRDKDLCEQRIRIERNRRKHLVQLSRAESVGGQCGRLLCKRSERDHDRNKDPNQSEFKKSISFHVFSSFMLYESVNLQPLRY